MARGTLEESILYDDHNIGLDRVPGCPGLSVGADWGAGGAVERRRVRRVVLCRRWILCNETAISNGASSSARARARSAAE